MLVIDNITHYKHVVDKLTDDYLDSIDSTVMSNVLKFNIRKGLILTLLYKVIKYDYSVKVTYPMLSNDVLKIIRTHYIEDVRLEDELSSSMANLKICENTFIDVMLDRNMLIMVMENV